MTLAPGFPGFSPCSRGFIAEHHEAAGGRAELPALRVGGGEVRQRKGREEEGKRWWSGARHSDLLLIDSTLY